MMQRLVDNAIAVTKESVKTFTYESLNNIVIFINGVSALLLAFLPGKTSILEGIHGWELRHTFRGPRFPRWMENDVSSFNQFIHELSVDSDSDGSNVSIDSAEEYSDDDICPASPSSQSSRISRSYIMPRHSTGWMWITFILSWILFPARFLLGIPSILFRTSYNRCTTPSSEPGRSPLSQRSSSMNRMQFLKDHIIQRTTDRRRGVIEDLHLAIEIVIEAVFDVVHKGAYFVLSPFDALRTLFRLFSSNNSKYQDTHGSAFRGTGMKRSTTLTYIDLEGKMHHVSKGAPEQINLLLNKFIKNKEGCISLKFLVLRISFDI